MNKKEREIGVSSGLVESLAVFSGSCVTSVVCSLVSLKWVYFSQVYFGTKHFGGYVTVFYGKVTSSSCLLF